MIRQVLRGVVRNVVRWVSGRFFNLESTDPGFTPRSIGDTDGNRLTLGDESLWHECKAEEVRQYGKRRVENLLEFSEDFSQSDWTKVSTATVTGTNTLNFPATNDRVSQILTRSIVAGASYIGTVKLSGSGTVTIAISRDGAGTFEQSTVEVTLTATPTRYAISHTFANTQTGIRLDIFRESDDTATEVTATEAMLEESTGRADLTTPSEYVSTGVGTGDELFSSPTLGVWVDNGDGSYTLTGDGSFQPLLSDQSNPEGATYLFSFTVDSISGGGLKAFSGNSQTVASSAGDYKTVLIADAADQLGFARQGTDIITVTISNISVKRIDHGANVDGVTYKSTENGNSVASNVVTEGDGAALDDLGSELITNGAFDNGTTDWSVLFGTLSIVDGTLRVTNDSSPSSGRAYQTFATIPGVKYTVTAKFIHGGATNGSIVANTNTNFGSALGGFNATLSSSQSVEFDFVAAGTTTYINFGNGGSTTSQYNDWDNISVRRSPTIKGTFVEGAATEISGYSADLANAAGWGQTNVSASQDAVGLTGEPNTATTLTDSDGANTGFINYTSAVADDTTEYRDVTWVAYDASPSVYPRIFLGCTGAAGVRQACVLDPSDGTYTEPFTDGSVVSVSRIGDFWRVEQSVTNDASGNTTLNRSLVPAYNNDGSITEDATVTGSTVFAVSGVFDTTSSWSPILTTGGTTKTRLADTEFTLDGSNWPDGTVSGEFELTSFFVDNVAAWGVLSAGTSVNSGLSYNNSGTARLSLNDGTNNINFANAWTNPEDTVKIKFRANAELGVMNFSVDGVAATETSYDGSFNPSGDITFFKSLTLGAAMKNLKIWSTDQGSNWLNQP